MEQGKQRGGHHWGALEAQQHSRSRQPTMQVSVLQAPMRSRMTGMLRRKRIHIWAARASRAA